MTKCHAVLEGVPGARDGMGSLMRGGVSAALLLSAGAHARAADADPVLSLHPKGYAAFHLQDQRIDVDGVLDDAAWEAVPFTDAFMDVQGPLHWSQPWFLTRAKLRYDDEFLYVGAYVRGSEIWANESRRNAVVFHDNDFEVFVDPDGSTHNYKEIEVNARNATWNLWLDKPYRSGGHENSTRVDPTHGFDMFGRGFRSAVYVDGRLNDPAQRAHYWTVEMALPLRELVRHTRIEAEPLPPKPKTLWRINFSRVQWHVKVSEDGRRYEKIAGLSEENWVWSAQHAVDMHRPEWWGYLEFRGRNDKPPVDPSSLIPPTDHLWPVRCAAFQLFYAQEAYKMLHGHYAMVLDAELKALFPIQDALRWFQLKAMRLDKGSYSAELFNCDIAPFTSVFINSESLLSIVGNDMPTEVTELQQVE